MKADAWECGHRMPFIVRWPGVVKPNSVSEKTISFVDFVATADELVAGNAFETADKTDVGPDSFSFLGELTGKPSDRKQRTSLALKSGRGLMTIRRGDWKLIDGDGSGGFSGRGSKPEEQTGTGQLYNLAEDLGETNNLIDAHPEIADSLRRELGAIVSAKRSRDLQ